MEEIKNDKNNHKHGAEKEEISAAVKEEKIVSLKESEYLALLQEAKKSVEMQDRMLRNQADLENIRKRLEREKQDFIKFANEGLVLDLLNVLDDLERTVNLAESTKQDFEAFLKGVEMILAHLYEMLKEHGVKPLEAEGKIFDPNFHEALMQVEDKDLPEHTIVEVLQKGYLINERVLRTAKVKVSKKTT
ncbi:MAG: nucleotide exchange factor GrpE [Candidatus Omnitrophica bacterium]|jgi:molecular chaperone GrpE|nr:nucleotide exchange factor GrpE [Candidatus Omnitrophota bacterium]